MHFREIRYSELRYAVFLLNSCWIISMAKLYR